MATSTAPKTQNEHICKIILVYISYTSQIDMVDEHERLFTHACVRLLERAKIHQDTYIDI